MNDLTLHNDKIEFPLCQNMQFLSNNKDKVYSINSNVVIKRNNVLYYGLFKM